MVKTIRAHYHKLSGIANVIFPFRPINYTYNGCITGPNFHFNPTIKKMCSNTEHLSPFSLTPLPTQPSPSSSSSHLHESPLPPQITSIITQFPEIFHEPDKLPPTRTIQHHIHLVPNTNPVNVKSYRYPHFQKTKLEQQVSSMLNAGLIQPNHNMFSSSVLIVKKKDGSFTIVLITGP